MFSVKMSRSTRHLSPVKSEDEPLRLSQSSESVNSLSFYMAYYFANLAYNAFLASVYTVMVFTPHHPCLSSGGYNITDRIDILFTLGYCGLIGDFVNTNIIGLIFTHRK